jgi:hypothetical protein
MTVDHARLRALAQAATPGPWHAPGMGEIHAGNHDEIAQILYHGDDEDGFCGTEADADFIAAANPATVIDLLDQLVTAAQHQDDLRTQLQRAHAQVRGLLSERDHAIRERNSALVRAITAEQKLAKITGGLAAIKRSDWDWDGRDDRPDGAWVLFDDVAQMAGLDPDDELDDVLPLRTPLPLNLPASLDLADSEGGSHD